MACQDAEMPFLKGIEALGVVDCSTDIWEFPEIGDPNIVP